MRGLWKCLSLLVAIATCMGDESTTTGRFAVSHDEYKQAYDDMVTEDGMPKYFSYTNSSQHNFKLRYVITTRNKNRSISLNLQLSSSVKEMDSCNRHFMNVYDGNNKSAPLLFSTCKKSDMPDDYVNTRIIGTEEQMLILYSKDEGIEPREMIFRYHAVPVNIHDCKEKHMISVNGSIQRITSPNYPDFFPMDYICTYVLTTTEENVIVLEPEDAKFTSGCGSIINVYEGTPLKPEDMFGHICGKDNVGKTFVSSNYKAMLEFRSQTFGDSGGWKVKVNSRKKTSGGKKEDVNLMIAALAFFVSSRIVLRL